MSLELLFLGTGTSAGIPMIGCACPVCRSDDPRDQRSRPSVLISYPSPGSAVESDQAAQWPSGAEKSETGLPRSSLEISPLDTAHITPHAPGVRRLLIDTAIEMRMQMLRHRISRIDGVLYTHSHADHVFGIDDLRRFNAVMQQPIDIYADAHTLDVLRRSFRYIFEPKHNINDSFIPTLLTHQIDPGRAFDLYGANWTPIDLLHGKLPMLGFRVDWPVSQEGSGVQGLGSGQTPNPTPQTLSASSLKSQASSLSIAYCTDISAIPDASLPLLRDLDVLVIDALRYTPHPTHLTIDQALKIVELLKPKRTFFTHLAHEISHAKLERELPDHVKPAYDGLCVKVEPTP